MLLGWLALTQCVLTQCALGSAAGMYIGHRSAGCCAAGQAVSGRASFLACSGG